MFDSVRDMLINTRYQALYARIDGYRRLSVNGEVYPGLIESAGDPVNGVLLLGISNTILPVLDQFEGDYYRRQSVTVMVPDRGLLEVETYLFRDEYRYLLSDREWSVEEFSKTGIKTFLSQYRGSNPHQNS